MLAIHAVQAENEPELVTDRPDRTESSSIVPPGYFQMETGWTFSHDEEDGTSTETHEFPSTLLRIGAMSRAELRLGWSGLIQERTHENGESRKEGGPGDAEIGVKLYFWEEQGWIPETALIAALSLPIGEEEFSSRKVDPSFRFALSHTLSERISLGYNFGAAWESDLDDENDRDSLAFFNYTATLGIGLSDRLGVFIELFGDVPINALGGPRHSFDGGITYRLLDNLQLDASAGSGFSSDADDWFAGLGLSVRFPR